MKKLLHVGAANRYYEGFENSDKMTEWKGKDYKLDCVMELGNAWDMKGESVDGIIGMHVFQQLPWRDLVVCFREAYRVLKLGGVLRMGVPTSDMTDRDLNFLLGWNNVNLLNFEILNDVLVKHIGFTKFAQREYQDSDIEEFKQIDNRKDRGTYYFEAVK